MNPVPLRVDIWTKGIVICSSWRSRVCSNALFIRIVSLDICHNDMKFVLNLDQTLINVPAMMCHAAVTY